MVARRFLSLALALLILAGPVALTAQERGSVTNLPIPRFVSIKASEANVRRGPSLTHRVDWVFQARDLPVEITAEHGHWRRIRDRDGVGGWVHHALLSGTRTALVEVPEAYLYARADEKSPIRAQVEANVIVRLLSCDGTWCRVSVDGYRGWLQQSQVWGTYPDEVLE
jgi:SH3-like domain-containing protein